MTLGTIELKDVVKGGIKERFVQMRQMGRSQKAAFNNPFQSR